MGRVLDREQLARMEQTWRENRLALRLNPDGGCMYQPHPMMVHSGRFWRCAHRRCEPPCIRCALAFPLLFLQWHGFTRRWPTRNEWDLLPDTLAGGVVSGDPASFARPKVPILWLRLWSFGMYYDIASDAHRWGQRVLVWHGLKGFRIVWREVRSCAL